MIPCLPEALEVERNALILKHLPQVQLVAHRIHARLPSHVSLDDLVSEGVVGLIRAIDRFDGTRQVKLQTYAERKIRGGILDSLRHLDSATRGQRRRAKQIDAAIAAVEQREQHVATDPEIAAQLNLTLESYRHWQAGTVRIESLESDDEHKSHLYVAADPNDLPSAAFESSQLRRALAAAFAELPENRKAVLELYYFHELTLREIATAVGLHESRISQIKADAIRDLRVALKTRWPLRGTAVAACPHLTARRERPTIKASR